MMATRRDLRRLAIQVLYQLDMRGSDDSQAIRRGLEGTGKPDDLCRQAFELAKAAWDRREEADRLVTRLAPHWPTHRQPPLDRSILRLACHEIAGGHAPARVAINEAVVLAKQYCAQQSPGFVNGVLDKVARHFDQPPRAAEPLVPSP